MPAHRLFPAGLQDNARIEDEQPRAFRLLYGLIERGREHRACILGDFEGGVGRAGVDDDQLADQRFH